MTKKIMQVVTQPYHGSNGALLFEPGYLFEVGADLPDKIVVEDVIVDPQAPGPGFSYPLPNDPEPRPAAAKPAAKGKDEGKSDSGRDEGKPAKAEPAKPHETARPGPPAGPSTATVRHGGQGTSGKPGGRS